VLRPFARPKLGFFRSDDSGFQGFPRSLFAGFPNNFKSVLVRRVAPEAKSTGGIIIPDSVKEKPMQGEVVAVGPDVRDANGLLHLLDVKGGDRVLFGKWSGRETKIDGEDLVIMQESDILGVIELSAANKKAA
jgi:chaperonin GroES